MFLGESQVDLHTLIQNIANIFTNIVMSVTSHVDLQKTSQECKTALTSEYKTLFCRHHSDQMSEGSQGSKVTLCVCPNYKVTVTE